MDSINLKNLTAEQAELVYRVLVSRVGAPNFGHSPEDFIQHFCGERPTTEWRFGGSLGFGGKLRFPQLTVDCYPEHENPERITAIALANTELGALREQFILEAKASHNMFKSSP